jgi:hypothetical protein
VRLRVVDHSPAAWFLLRHDGGEPDGEYYLDVNCGVSAYGFSVLIKLSQAEHVEYHTRGRDYINALARRIEADPFACRDRDLSRALGGDVSDAVGRFRDSSPDPP